jgi:hypothetical protein
MLRCYPLKANSFDSLFDMAELREQRDFLLKRLGLDQIAGQSRPLIAENFVFIASSFPAARNLEIVHEEVDFEETPLAVVRKVFLESKETKHTTLELRLTLCWAGFADAVGLLSDVPFAFERAISQEAILNTAERYQVGDAGVAWPWSGSGEPDVLVFVRNNVLVSQFGHSAHEILPALAREIDASLHALNTTTRYDDGRTGAFDEVRQRAGETPKVESGSRLDFGMLPGDERTHYFFLTTDGSVNRAPERPGAWYYRAGTRKGRQEITLFKLAAGILPIRERLIVEVT